MERMIDSFLQLMSDAFFVLYIFFMFELVLYS